MYAVQNNLNYRTAYIAVQCIKISYWLRWLINVCKRYTGKLSVAYFINSLLEVVFNTTSIYSECYETWKKGARPLASSGDWNKRIQ